MTIAEKILRAKADYDAVYEAGKNSGGGADSYYDTFWDVFQNNGGEANYYYAFAYENFTDVNYNPKHDIVCLSGANTSSRQMFYNCKITDTKVPIYANGTTFTQAFYGCTELRKIAKLVVHETLVFTGAFQNCSALEDIVIEGVIGTDINFRWSEKLTQASIRSIIDHLSPDTSEKTLTLSETAVNKAFETSEGANDGTTSAEWDVLGGTNRERQNWNISLV